MTADAYVTAAAPRGNFGGKKILRVGATPETRSYLKFERSEAPITRASLWVKSQARSARFQVRAVGSRWSEQSITFANAPRSRGAVIQVEGRQPVDGFIGVDVTRLVKGRLSVSLMLSGRGATFASREAGSGQPWLGYDRAWPALGAAGDIGDCDTPFDSATATSLDNGGASTRRSIGTIAALGDLVDGDGSLDDFNACYQPSWGPLKTLTKPVPGDREYQVPGAAGYFAYWGARAGNPNRGWYSYDIRRWHIVALNSNCAFIGGCHAGSPQERWLRADLAAHKTKCTLAYWHHPLFSGTAGTAEPRMAALWQALYDLNADVVLAAHAHNYQRFAPQTALGVADPARGIREFIVGSGGQHLLQPVSPLANLEAMNDTTWGALGLTLRDTGYDWYFFHSIQDPEGRNSDFGSAACH